MKIAFRNLFRRKLLTVFAVLGIMPGVSIVVSLLLLSASLEEAVIGLITDFPCDAIVHDSSALPLSPQGRVPVALAHELATLPEVREVDPFIRQNVLVSLYVPQLHDGLLRDEGRPAPQTARDAAPPERAPAENAPRDNAPGDNRPADNRPLARPPGVGRGRFGGLRGIADLANRLLAEKLPKAFLFLTGITPSGRLARDFRIVAGGRTFSSTDASEVLLGKTLVENLKAQIEQQYDALPGGDLDLKAELSRRFEQAPLFPDLIIGSERFTVVGIYETGNLLSEASALVPIGAAQRLAAMPGEATNLAVTFANGVDLARGLDAVRRVLPLSLVISDKARFNHKAEQNLARFRLMLFGIGLIATVGGALGILIIMLSNVHERTREIGLLLSVGWSRAMVLRTIVLEGVLIAIVGGVLGLALGVGWIRALEAYQGQELVRHYASGVFVLGLGLAVGLGMFGALLPAWRASRLSPVEAMRYE